MSAALWSPLAEQELDEILYYVARVDRRPATGERIYYEIKQLAEKYSHPMRPATGILMRLKDGSISVTKDG